jgi:hypothetical protein
VAAAESKEHPLVQLAAEVAAAELVHQVAQEQKEVAPQAQLPQTPVAAAVAQALTIACRAMARQALVLLV